MRLGMFLSLAFALMLSVWSTPSLAAVSGSRGTTVVAFQQPAGGGAQAQPSAQPSGKVDVDINVNHNGGGRWYAKSVSNVLARAGYAAKTKFPKMACF